MAAGTSQRVRGWMGAFSAFLVVGAAWEVGGYIDENWRFGACIGPFLV
jgi:hypothetical protein